MPRIRWTEDVIKEFVEKENYNFIKLLDERSTRKSKILIQCGCGHEPYIVKFEKFKIGLRCPYCRKDREWTKEKVINYVDKTDSKLIKIIKYKGSLSRLLIQCSHNHDPYEIDFYNFLRGAICPTCTIENKIRWKKDNIISYIENEGYNLIDILLLDGRKSRL